jgi:hypothetical protein
MAMDSIRYVYEHLEAISKEKSSGPRRVDLLLHSNGGEGTVPWRLVTLIREYADEFCVLVPNRAFSAATLTALGADAIVMHPMGMLGPTDPTVSNGFNPPNPNSPNERLGISVEDVTAYLALVREDAGIQHEDQVISAFNVLATQVHPLALGNVKRSLSQSRMMAKKLLCLHMDPADSAHRVETIVDNLTSKLFFHGHPINRREAKDQLGLTTVEDPTEGVKNAMWRLFLAYEKELALDIPFDVAMEFVQEFPSLNVGESNKTTKRHINTVFIESSFRTDVCSIEYELYGTKLADQSTTVQMLMSKRNFWNQDLS